MDMEPEHDGTSDIAAGGGGGATGAASTGLGSKYARVVSQLRVDATARQETVARWSQTCEDEAVDFHFEAAALETHYASAVKSTEHLGAPNAFRTALSLELLDVVSSKFSRFHHLMQALLRETTSAIYLPRRLRYDHYHTGNGSDDDEDDESNLYEGGAFNDDTSDNEPPPKEITIARMMAQRAYFAELHAMIEAKAALNDKLEQLDRQHAFMTKQLRTKEKMVDRVAQRWARVVMKQALVDWKKIILRKKYTRVLLEKTSRRWSKQRLQRLFRLWAAFAKNQKIQRTQQKLQHLLENKQDFQELLVKLEVQIESAKLEAKDHREHYDHAKRQLLALEDLLAQLDARIKTCNERKLQAIVNQWGHLCLAFVDVECDHLQNMLQSLAPNQYVDVTALVAKGEEMADLLALPSDVLVLRWINYQLSKSATFRYYKTSPGGFVQNYSSDMKNMYVLRHVLQHVLTHKHQAHQYMAAMSAPEAAPTNTKTSAASTASTTAAPGHPHPHPHHHHLQRRQSSSMNVRQPDIVKRAPFASKDELRGVLEEQLVPPCPPLLSHQVMESDPASDLLFCAFAFLVCEHPSLMPLPPSADCPWREAQTALDDARAVWQTVRQQWTELHTPFEIKEVTKMTPDLTSPPQLLLKANTALHNAVNMVQYACSKRAIVMKTWGCVQRKVQQDAFRLLLRRARREAPLDMLDRRIWREKFMLTTLHVPKVIAAILSDEENPPEANETTEVLEQELAKVEQVLEDNYVALRRVYRFYASIDSTNRYLEGTQKLPTATGATGTATNTSASVAREIAEEERFFSKISMSMSLMEFHEFLKDTKVFGTARPFPYAFILRVFEQVNEEVAASTEEATFSTRNLTLQQHHQHVYDENHDHDATEMTPAEFVEALVHIVRSKFVRGGLKASTAAAFPSLPLAQRLRRVLDEVILPNAMQERENTSSNLFRRMLLTAECREVFTKHQKHLHNVYVRFAGANDKDSTQLLPLHPSRRPPHHRRVPMLSLNGFVLCLKHFDLLKENYLILDEVQHLLASILQLERDSIRFDLEMINQDANNSLSSNQNDTAEQNSRLYDPSEEAVASLFKPSTPPTDPALEQGEELLLTYAEFLEAMAAVACYHRPDPFIPLATKLDEFFSEHISADK
ncbi:TPA: hypothetical protein N0F65_012491 [Lagenidium giganteum]|uniref:Calponin-homology (CH) domain-containing protein n=1 Tax=Lagenidium giganteum TaxID=4803 RepID=A0AAV2YN62_9STRA|nr:TPA: hypothetical protein N0F65_012491 [Lagenidium giganteum]